MAFADPGEIELWLVVAETERLSTAALRIRVRAHVAATHGSTHTEAMKSSVAAFRLLRELRATGRALARERHLWRRWSPAAAQLALEELHQLTEFVDAVRASAIEHVAKQPRDLHAN